MEPTHSSSSEPASSGSTLKAHSGKGPRTKRKGGTTKRRGRSGRDAQARASRPISTVSSSSRAGLTPQAANPANGKSTRAPSLSGNGAKSSQLNQGQKLVGSASQSVAKWEGAGIDREAA